jgi:hypothetical protein
MPIVPKLATAHLGLDAVASRAMSAFRLPSAGLFHSYCPTTRTAASGRRATGGRAWPNSRIHRLLAALLAGTLPVAAAVGPYPSDVHTLQLWHFDEPGTATDTTNAVVGAVTLGALMNGATLGHPALPGLGLAASTYDGGPGATLSANPNGIPGRDAAMGPAPFVNGTDDNTLVHFTGTNGAFTLEALVRADFNPAALATPPDSSRDMQIISADAEETLRLFQFRLYWSSANDATPELQFINIGSAVQTLSANLPLTGSNAFAASNWYHVAVTYNGQPNTADNCKLYWTRAETNRTRADLLASLRMTNHVPVGTADWAIGNEGRATGGAAGNWVGLIDEVRLSSIARAEDALLFYADTDNDGLPDAWETLHFDHILAQGVGGDPDGDGFTNLEEYHGGSNPRVRPSVPADKDADGLPDAWEVSYFGHRFSGPADDPDLDGFTNAQELAAGSNPADSTSNPNDADRDGLPDAWETLHWGHLNYTAADDPDGDGFTNAQEFAAGTNPANSRSFPARPVTTFTPVEDGNPDTSEYGYAGSSSINSVSFIRSALTTVGGRQFIAYYGRHVTNAADTNNNRIVVARRALGAATWEVFRTAFTANDITDGHDVTCIGVDGEGYLHMSWGMHGNPYHYARTTTPVTGNQAIVFGPDGTMTGQEGNVTYPQFLPLPNGDLLYKFREGGSGNGNNFLNRYSVATRTWANVHRNGSVQAPFIQGTGWTPNYNAYWQMPGFDSLGRLHLVWTWRYNSDSPAGEAGYQTNHDFAYGWSPDFGLTWRRSDGREYVLPINERGENGNPDSIAERVLAIPEGWSLINQAGMCLDTNDRPVIASWWAPGAGTNAHRRQYLVAFPGTNALWESRQISHRTIDPPGTKYAESSVRDLGRPVIVCDRAGRLIVLYRDNDGSNGLTIAYSLPYENDPQRLFWTTVDLTVENAGSYEPVIDQERWARDNVLQILYQRTAGLGYTPPANTASPIGVLEWDAATYFAHRPTLEFSFANEQRDAVLSFLSQKGWSYRLWTSTNLQVWQEVTTAAGNGTLREILEPDGGLGAQRFWRLEIQEGAFQP